MKVAKRVRYSQRAGGECIRRGFDGSGYLCGGLLGVVGGTREQGWFRDFVKAVYTILGYSFASQDRVTKNLSPRFPQRHLL